LSSGADATLDLPIGDPARRDGQMPLVLDGVTDAATGSVITPRELAARLDGVRLLFVGESHTDIEFHRVHLRLLEELHERNRPLLIGLEMYPVASQSWLDRWIQDPAMTEEAFLRESHWYRNWGYNWNYYREIFLFARRNGIRLFGLNVPRTLVQSVRKEGFAALSPEERALLPERIDTDDAEHLRLFRSYFDDDDPMHGGLPEEMVKDMYRAQCTWDAAMGWNAVRVLEEHGGAGAIEVVLAGTGHVAYGLGAERQAHLWYGGRTASLIPVPVAESPGAEGRRSVRASYADFVWGVPPPGDPLYPTLGIALPETKSGERYPVILVTPDSVAEAAGFEVGDELVSMDGVPIDDKETVNRVVAEKHWGDTAVCKVVRGGEELTLTAYFRRQLPSEAAPGHPSEGAQ